MWLLYNESVYPGISIDIWWIYYKIFSTWFLEGAYALKVLIIESKPAFAGLLKANVLTMLVRHKPQVTIAEDLDTAVGMLATSGWEFDLLISARNVRNGSGCIGPRDRNNGLQMITDLVNDKKTTRAVKVIILSGTRPRGNDPDFIYVLRRPLRPAQTLLRLQNAIYRLCH